MATRIRFQLRRGVSTEWTSVNPVLLQGEPGVETDTGKLKIGNGTGAWSTLPYATGGDISGGEGYLAGLVEDPADPGTFTYETLDSLGATTLAELTDVNLTTIVPQEGDVLGLRNGKWAPYNPPEPPVTSVNGQIGDVNLDLGFSTLEALDDVTTLGVTEGQALVYSGGEWRPGTVAVPDTEPAVGTMTYRGEWVEGTTYAAGDVVSYGGQLWVATTSGATTPTAPTAGGGGAVEGATSVPWIYDFHDGNAQVEQGWTFHTGDGSDPEGWFYGEAVSQNSRETGLWTGKANTANALVIYPSPGTSPHTARWTVTFAADAVLSFWDAYSAPARPEDYVAFTVNGTEVYRTAHNANATAWNGLGIQRQPWTRHTYPVQAGTPYVFEWAYHAGSPEIGNGPYNMFWLAGVQATLDGVEDPHPNPYATAWSDDFTSWETRSAHWHVLQEISYANGRAQGFLGGWPSRIMASYEATATRPGSARDGTGVWTDIRVSSLPEALDPHLIINENRATGELYHYRPRDGQLLRWNNDSGYTTLGTVAGATLTGGATVTITVNNGAFSIQQVDGAGTHTGSFTDPNPVKGGGWGINIGYDTSDTTGAVASYDSFSWAPLAQPMMLQSADTGEVLRSTGATGQWRPLGGGTPAATALDALTDVSTAGAATGQVLVYNGSVWAPAAPAAGSAPGSMVWRNAWNAATAYVYGDVVTTEEGIFVALQANTGKTPAVPLDPFDDQFERANGPIGTSFDLVGAGWQIVSGKASITQLGTGLGSALVNTRLSSDGTGLWTAPWQENSAQGSQLVWGWTDTNNYYFFNMPDGKIFRRSGGTSTELGRASSPTGQNLAAIPFYSTVRVVATGGTFQVSAVYGSVTYSATVTDPAPLGGVGWGIVHARYANSTVGDTTTLGGFAFTQAPPTNWGVVERKWSISSMRDVNTVAAGEGNVLSFNVATGKWEPRVAAAGGQLVAVESATLPGAYDFEAAATRAGRITVAATTPTDPQVNDLWVDTSGA